MVPKIHHFKPENGGGDIFCICDEYWCLFGEELGQTNHSILFWCGQDMHLFL